MTDKGAELLARLRTEAKTDADYVALLERHAAEGIRVNVGLIVENAELKRRAASHLSGT